MSLPDRPPFDPDAIPVLTERLYVPTLPPLMPVEEAAELPVPAAPNAAPAVDAAPSEPQTVGGVVADVETDPPMAAAALGAAAPAMAPATGAAMSAIDIGVVRDAVLDDLERVLPAQIESLIRREVSNAIDDAVFRVVAETQDALARAIGQVVERAVKDELDRLRNEGG